MKKTLKRGNAETLSPFVPSQDVGGDGRTPMPPKRVGGRGRVVAAAAIFVMVVCAFAGGPWGRGGGGMAVVKVGPYPKEYANAITMPDVTIEAVTVTYPFTQIGVCRAAPNYACGSLQYLWFTVSSIGIFDSLDGNGVYWPSINRGWYRTQEHRDYAVSTVEFMFLSYAGGNADTISKRMITDTTSAGGWISLADLGAFMQWPKSNFSNEWSEVTVNQRDMDLGKILAVNLPRMQWEFLDSLVILARPSTQSNGMSIQFYGAAQFVAFASRSSIGGWRPQIFSRMKRNYRFDYIPFVRVVNNPSVESVCRWWSWGARGLFDINANRPWVWDTTATDGVWQDSTNSPNRASPFETSLEENFLVHVDALPVNVNIRTAGQANTTTPVDTIDFSSWSNVTYSYPPGYVPRSDRYMFFLHKRSGFSPLDYNYWAFAPVLYDSTSLAGRYRFRLPITEKAEAQDSIKTLSTALVANNTHGTFLGNYSTMITGTEDKGGGYYNAHADRSANSYFHQFYLNSAQDLDTGAPTDSFLLNTAHTGDSLTGTKNRVRGWAMSHHDPIYFTSGFQIGYCKWWDNTGMDTLMRETEGAAMVYTRNLFAGNAAGPVISVDSIFITTGSCGAEKYGNRTNWADYNIWTTAVSEVYNESQSYWDGDSTDALNLIAEWTAEGVSGSKTNMFFLFAFNTDSVFYPTADTRTIMACSLYVQLRPKSWTGATAYDSLVCYRYRPVTTDANTHSTTTSFSTATKRRQQGGVKISGTSASVDAWAWFSFAVNPKEIVKGLDSFFAIGVADYEAPTPIAPATGQKYQCRTKATPGSAGSPYLKCWFRP